MRFVSSVVFAVCYIEPMSDFANEGAVYINGGLG